MENNKLPTDDLKKYGIIDSNNSFSQKMSIDDVQQFLQGETIKAINDKKEINFNLTDNNTRLNVKMFEKDRSHKEIIDSVSQNPRAVQYSYETEISKDNAEKNFTKLAFLMKSDMNVYRFDMVKDAEKLTEIIAERKDEAQITIYKTELQKLQSFLQDKIDKYPEAAKQITENLNIVSNEINSVNSISISDNPTNKVANTNIELDVNDRDLYEDVNRNREEEEQDQNQDEERKKGFRR